MKKFLLLFTVYIFYSNFLFGQSKCDTLIFQSNGSAIRGYFYASSQVDSPTLIFTQAFFATGDIWNIGKTLSAKGINVFMFDFRGCFKSEGRQGLLNSQEDIKAAIEFLKSKLMTRNYDIDTSDIIIGGYSYGGHMSMLYAVHHPEIKRVLSISGGDLGILADIIKADSTLLTEYSDFFRSIRKPNGPVEFEYSSPIDELTKNQDYFYILKQVKRLANTDILMTGGLDDKTVSLEKMVLPLYRALKKNENQKVKCIIYQTNHSYKDVTSKLLQDIIEWVK